MTSPRQPLLDVLREVSPAFARRLPLALGMSAQIRAAYPEWDGRQIWLALTKWTNNPAYQAALAKPDARRANLDGSDAGPVSEEHRAIAHERAVELGAKAKAKRAARRAQREAEKAAAERKAAQLAAEAKRNAAPQGRAPVVKVKKRRSVARNVMP